MGFRLCRATAGFCYPFVIVKTSTATLLSGIAFYLCGHV